MSCGYRTDSQAHVQCSETFYKSTVMDQIASDPQAGLDDKKAMLEMLRRFEDQAGTDGQDRSLGLDDEEEEEDELERRLRDVDIGMFARSCGIS